MSNSEPVPNEPSPLSASGVPSSFDSTPEFFEESRVQKLWRKLRQEPLIPLGCAATCYALYMATKSIRQGDHNQTNRMFRARIYAQGFTLLALVAGSIFYKDERLKRKTFETALDEKKAAEKRDKWLKELEARDEEDRKWREKIENASQAEARQVVKETKAQTDSIGQEGKENLHQLQAPEEGKKESKIKGGWWFSNKSVQDEVTDRGWGPGMWTKRTRDAWKKF